MFAFTFYLFALVACVSGVMVVLGRNPVHSVLWLILAFVASAGLFVLQGAEFLAMLLIIVYVGAVAVLFLFVVMMLDIDFAALRAEVAKYLPFGLVITLLLLVQMGLVFGGWVSADGADALRAAPIPADRFNTEALGAVVYDRYLLAFQTGGLVLLVAMIGAIVLTIRHRTDIKRQDVLTQMYRDPKAAIRMVDPKPGQGL